MALKNISAIPKVVFAVGITCALWPGYPVAASAPDVVADVAAGPDFPALKSADQHFPQAKSVQLREPVPIERIDSAITPAVTAEEAPLRAPPLLDARPLVMLGTEVPPLTSTRLSWSPAQSFEGLASPTPVLVVHGARAGPTLCLTAATHGDEINGIEIVRRVLYNIDAEDLSGTIIGVPIVNLQGFRRNSRYLPDRRDLNRYFPGYPQGSSAARIAYSFFHEVIEKCTTLVDLHTGSFDRSNLPQLRADLSSPDVLALTLGFGATVVLHSEGALGTLRRAAVERGIPAVTLEAGGPMRLQEDAVRHGVKGIHTLLNHLKMVKKSRSWGAREPVYYNSTWVRANMGGILLSKVELGERIEQDDMLGTITNPITNVRTVVRSPREGRVLGMALDQVVMPGYAAYHIGISTDTKEIPFVQTQSTVRLAQGETLQSTDQAGDTGAVEAVEAVEVVEVVDNAALPDELPDQD